ncbi:MAG: hypothetical protein HY056_07145, partial [Proteobacteria bacterium]|nr:hypothetical protein [Pseudomonadota bacterium]
RFPVGTRYIIEGEPVAGGTRINASYLLFPNGKRIDLSKETGRVVTCSCVVEKPRNRQRLGGEMRPFRLNKPAPTIASKQLPRRAASARRARN